MPLKSSSIRTPSGPNRRVGQQSLVWQSLTTRIFSLEAAQNADVRCREVLEAALGIRYDYSVEELSVRMPAPAEGEILHLAPGVPVLRALRTAYATSPDSDEPFPVDVIEDILAGDRYILMYRFPLSGEGAEAE